MAENIEVLIQVLKEGDEARRIEAAQALASLEKSSKEIVRALECAVVSDPSQEVQEAVLAALAAPVHHQIHRQILFLSPETRRTILFHINEWAADGLITPQAKALLKGRYALEPPRLPKPETVPEAVIRAPKPDRVIPREPATPKEPIKKKEELFEGEIAAEGTDVVEQPFLEKQKFSLVGTLTSEITIKIALYLGAFLIVSAAVIFAGLVEPARFPMLTVTLLGFLTAARATRQRLPLGSFVLFVIGTLLIPIDAAIFFALINIHASLLYWAVVTAGMSLIWGWGTYVYQSRALSLVVFATFSVAVYLVAASYLSIESAGFLLVVSLVALAGLGEAALLRRWQGDSFFEPMFAAAQLQALLVLGILGGLLLSQVNDVLASIDEERRLSGLDSQNAALLGGWLILGGFYFASDRLTWRWKKWDFPVFPLLVTICLMTPPIFIMEAMSAGPHLIAAVLWGWGALAVMVAEAFHSAPIRWARPYELLFLCTSLLFLMAAPLVECATTLEYAAGYFLATSLVYFVLAYRRKHSTIWSVALVAAYLAYLVGVKALSAGKSPVFVGFALVVPALVFLSVELAGRRYFRANDLWTVPPLLLGLFNLVWDVGILLSWYNEHPGSAVIILFIGAAFGALYAALDDQRERGQATAAWTAGLIAVNAAYFYVLPNAGDISFGGYMLLAPALVFLSAELVGKRYFQAGPSWTLPLLGLGLFNVALDVLVTLVGGLDSYTGSAAIIFLIYGLFGALYAVLDMRFERDYATIAWTAGLIALYVAYGFVYLLPAIQDLDIFPGYVLLLPMLVFLSAELVGKLRFRLSPFWTLPLLGSGLFSAALVIPVTLIGGLDSHPGSAAIIFLIYGLFAVLVTVLDVRFERDYAITAWTAGLIALYAAYGFVYRLPAIRDLDIFPGFFLLLPMLVFLSADLVGKLRFRASQSLTLPLFRLGLLSAALVVPVTLNGGLDSHPGSAAIIFLIYGLFAVLYAALDVQFERDYAITAWTAGLIALYAAYGFVYRLPAIQDLDIFPGFFLLLPMLVFLSAELVGKLRFRASQSWTLPLFGLGLLSAVLVVLVTLDGGLNGYPHRAAMTFLIYGLFGVLYAVLDAPSDRDHAIIAWTAGLLALYVAYGFVYLLPAIEDEDYFPGFALLIPALVYLSAELAGRRYFRVSQAWTQPLLGLGILNAVLVVPIALDGGLNGSSGSAAIVFLMYGLFSALYAEFDARSELSYVATSSITVALGFAILFYDQDQWVMPFTVLALLYYLGGLAVGHVYQRRDWSQALYWSGLAIGTATALSAPVQGGGDAVVGMAVIATVYGAEAFRRQNVWLGLPANGLFLGAYLMALQELNVTEPQFYSVGTGLLAIVTHYLMVRRSEQQEAFVIGFAMGVTAQVILLGTSFYQMSAGLQFYFFLLFFQSLILLAYGLVIRSLCFTIVPILFIVGGVLRVVFTLLASYSTVVTIGCTGLALVLLGITALIMRERLLKTYEEFRQAEE